MESKLSSLNKYCKVLVSSSDMRVDGTVRVQLLIKLMKLHACKHIAFKKL